MLVCCSQNMFSSASGFNQPVAAWDVGKVMKVRRHLASGLWGLLGTQLARGVVTNRACVLVVRRRFGVFSMLRSL